MRLPVVDSSDTVEEKKLNTEDEGLSEEDPIQKLEDDLDNLHLSVMVERGPLRRKTPEDIKIKPYERHDIGRVRTDSVESESYSDVSITSPLSDESSSIIYFEHTHNRNLIDYERPTEKPVVNKIIVPNKTEEVKQSPTISEGDEKESNLQDTSEIDQTIDTPKKTIFEQLKLNDEVLKQKWLDLIVFSKQDIFATDTEGLTILHRLLKEHQNIEHLPEALYTVMEELKQNPSRCKVFVDSRDKILKAVKSLKMDTALLEKYFEMSFIVISMLCDYRNVDQ